MSTAINAVFNWTTGSWGWLYLITAFVLVLSCAALMVGRFGTYKLGLPERQTVAATLLLPTLGDFLWYGVIGGAGIKYDVTGPLTDHGVESAIFAIAQHLPLTGIVAVCLIFLIATFFLTSANSAALALAMFVSGRETPGKNLRAFWGIALGTVAAVLAGTGSFKPIQTASIATAFPMMFLLLLVMYGTFKGLSRVTGEKVTPARVEEANDYELEGETTSAAAPNV